MEQKKLFLLDAYALIYRAYYALIRSPRITSGGLNTSAIFGFCNTLDEVLRKESPTHIAVCFDPKGKTFRHEAYGEYKAQRDKQPEDITLSLPYIKRILAAHHIPAVEIEGFEADDVIGTLSRMAQAQGFITYMMTPDKDYCQLVTDRVFMYKPGIKGGEVEIRGPKEVCDKFLIDSPEQVIDMLALEGDTVDNIPGCPGVGEKTAAKLISAWGSVENLLAHTQDVKGAVQKKIIENEDNIRFSKFLATIRTDVPLGDITIDSLARQRTDVEALAAVYRELEFRTFLNRLGVKEYDSGAAMAVNKTVPESIPSLFDFDEDEDTISQPLSGLNHDEVTYTLAASVSDVTKVVETLSSCPKIGIAIYARGEQSMTAQLEGIALCGHSGLAVYVPVPYERSSRKEIIAALAPILAGNAMVVSMDIKRDMLLLRRENLNLTTNYFDNAVAHYLLDPEMKHTLSILAGKYLNYNPVDMDMPVRSTVKDAPMAVDEATLRFCEEADLSLRLQQILLDNITTSGLLPLLESIELPLIRVLADMEWTGVRIDVRELDTLAQRFSQRLDDMERKIYDLAGGKFNISSPMQVGDVLFDRLKIDDNAKRTKKGGYSTTEDILEKLRKEHPIVDLILQYRALKKLLTTYVTALPALVNANTGKIHTSYNQTVTATGRISSTNPNLQNIPIRTDDGREIRRAFIPDKGDLLLSADYSQIELRLMAEMSGDPSMIEAFLEGQDIHSATAAKIYHLTPQQVTEDQRRNAKTANFGIIYGITAFGLSERLGISRAEAKALIDGYFATYPGVKEYMTRSIEHAREQGFVTTIMGRKRILPDIGSRSSVVRGYAERNAINAPLQGSAADIIKKAMVDIDRHIAETGLKSRMIMQVHDELVFNVKPEELDRLQKIVTEDMENAFKGTVPLLVSCGTGNNWLQAH